MFKIDYEKWDEVYWILWHATNAVHSIPLHSIKKAMNRCMIVIWIQIFKVCATDSQICDGIFMQFATEFVKYAISCIENQIATINQMHAKKILI